MSTARWVLCGVSAARQDCIAQFFGQNRSHCEVSAAWGGCTMGESKRQSMRSGKITVTCVCLLAALAFSCFRVLCTLPCAVCDRCSFASWFLCPVCVCLHIAMLQSAPPLPLPSRVRHASRWHQISVCIPLRWRVLRTSARLEVAPHAHCRCGSCCAWQEVGHPAQHAAEGVV